MKYLIKWINTTVFAWQIYILDSMTNTAWGIYFCMALYKKKAQVESNKVVTLWYKYQTSPGGRLHFYFCGKDTISLYCYTILSPYISLIPVQTILSHGFIPLKTASNCSPWPCLFCRSLNWTSWPRNSMTLMLLLICLSSYDHSVLYAVAEKQTCFDFIC